MENENTSTPLSLNDIITMKDIINIVSARGAFRPEEMVIVGQLYNKLSEFIVSVNATQEQTSQTGTDSGIDQGE